MLRLLGVSLIALTLTACGGGDGGGNSAADEAAANNPACALIGDTAATFGQNADVSGYEGDAPIAASCEFLSADGTRSGGVLLFTQESLAAVTPADQVAAMVERWDGATDTALQPVAELGPEARLATDLPGYQTQIVFAKGQTVVAVLGSSGDNAMSGEQIARALAQAASAGIDAS